MKVVTNLIHRNGKTVSYGDFAITFDGDGQAEVTPEQFSQMQEIDASISEVGKGAKKQSPVKHTVTEDDVKANPDLTEEGVKVGDEVEIEETVSLSSMTVKELQSIAKEANLPNDEWQRLNKADLIKYIESKA